MIINSILDNDFYKFTMMHAAREKYPNATVRYAFINRSPNAFTFTEDFFNLLQSRIQELASLKLTDEEYTWLAAQKLLPLSFLDYLRDFRLNPEYISSSLDKNGQLVLSIQGPWQDTILFEVPLLSLIAQTYYETIEIDWENNLEAYYSKTLEKGKKLSQAGCCFSDFGTRRRRSYDLQRVAIEAFSSLDKSNSTYTGTSNVHFSHLHNTKPIGTMAHEWIMGHGGLFGIDKAHVTSLQAWLEAHKGNYTIALTDTYTTDLFFKDFTKELAETYVGIRHDSGSPSEFTDKAVKFYKDMGIDPKTKKIVYSDGLDVDKAIAIQQYAGDKVQPAFGIGTSFTNDFNHSKSVNIVIKLAQINGKDVAKITDTPTKASGPIHAIKETAKDVESLTHKKLDIPNF